MRPLPPIVRPLQLAKMFWISAVFLSPAFSFVFPNGGEIFSPVFPKSCRMTNPTLAPTSRKERVGVGKLMSPFAMSSPCEQTSVDVFFSRNRLKMFGVHTCSISTQMIKHQSCGYRPFEQFISETMCPNVFISGPQYPIAVYIACWKYPACPQRAENVVQFSPEQIVYGLRFTKILPRSLPQIKNYLIIRHVWIAVGTSQDILCPCHWLKMVRIDAERNAAQVINDHAIWDYSPKRLITEDVGQTSPARFNVECPVMTGSDCGCPNPTARFDDDDLLPKPFFNRFVVSPHVISVWSSDGKVNELEVLA